MSFSWAFSMGKLKFTAVSGGNHIIRSLTYFQHDYLLIRLTATCP